MARWGTSQRDNNEAGLWSQVPPRNGAQCQISLFLEWTKCERIALRTNSCRHSRKDLIRTLDDEHGSSSVNREQHHHDPSLAVPESRSHLPSTYFGRPWLLCDEFVSRRCRTVGDIKARFDTRRRCPQAAGCAGVATRAVNIVSIGAPNDPKSALDVSSGTGSSSCCVIAKTGSVCTCWPCVQGPKPLPGMARRGDDGDRAHDTKQNGEA